MALHHELFQEQKSPNRIVYLSEDFLDFGFTSKASISPAREIQVYNNLPCEMTVLWTIPDTLDNKQPAFRVFPASATLKPLSSCKFEVSFCPDKASQYFYQEVEYYAIKHISSNQVRRLEEAKKQLLSQTNN